MIAEQPVEDRQERSAASGAELQGPLCGLDQKRICWLHDTLQIVGAEDGLLKRDVHQVGQGDAKGLEVRTVRLRLAYKDDARGREVESPDSEESSLGSKVPTEVDLPMFVLTQSIQLSD